MQPITSVTTVSDGKRKRDAPDPVLDAADAVAKAAAATNPVVELNIKALLSRASKLDFLASSVLNDVRTRARHDSHRLSPSCSPCVESGRQRARPSPAQPSSPHVFSPSTPTQGLVADDDAELGAAVPPADGGLPILRSGLQVGASVDAINMPSCPPISYTNGGIQGFEATGHCLFKCTYYAQCWVDGKEDAAAFCTMVSQNEPHRCSPSLLASFWRAAACSFLLP